MQINKIQSYITPKTTGYAAVAGLALTTVSGISKTKSFKKLHKPLSIVTAGFTLLHLGLIEYYNFKYKHKAPVQQNLNDSHSGNAEN